MQFSEIWTPTVLDVASTRGFRPSAVVGDMDANRTGLIDLYIPSYTFTRNRRAAKRGSFLVANDVRAKGLPSLLCEVANTKTNSSSGTLIRMLRRDFRVSRNGEMIPPGR